MTECSNFGGKRDVNKQQCLVEINQIMDNQNEVLSRFQQLPTNNHATILVHVVDFINFWVFATIQGLQCGVI